MTLRIPNRILDRLEVIAAGLLFLLAIVFRLVFATHAGGLWRDEANTVGLATMPLLSDVWRYLQYDSFPLAWLMILRSLSAAGIASDLWLRFFSFAVGMILIAGIWLHARLFNYRLPLVSLAIFGLNPCVICWGGTVRAYGFGIMTVVYTIPVLWKFIQSGERKWFAASLLISLISVHTLFYNAVVIFGCSVGGFAVLLRKGLWRRALSLLMIGLMCASSLLPYLQTIIGASDWNMLCQTDNFDVAFFFVKLNEALSPAGPMEIWFWAVSFLAAVVLCLTMLLTRRFGRPNPIRFDSLLFALVSLLVGGLSYYFFLSSLHYPTQPWYYLVLLTLIASTVDTILGIASLRWNWIAASRIMLAAIVMAATFHPVLSVAMTRLTNVDLVAAKLRTIVTDKDLVLINPWFVGVSFNRYYDGKASWESIPKIDFFRVHRYDLIKAKMMEARQSDVIAPNTRSISATLKGGGRVFIVGGLQFLKQNESPLVLPPAPNSPYKWQDGPYLISYSTQTAAFIQQHARTLNLIEVPVNQTVNPFENSPLLIVEGWRGGPIKD